MSVSNTICILHWGVRPHCDHQWAPRGVCEKCVYPMNVWSVCVRRASSRQKARSCCLTLICKGRQYGSLTCPGPLSVAHTSPGPPRWPRRSLNTSSRLPQGGETEGDAGCFDNDNLWRKDREAQSQKFDEHIYNYFWNLSPDKWWETQDVCSIPSILMFPSKECKSFQKRNLFATPLSHIIFLYWLICNCFKNWFIFLFSMFAPSCYIVSL